MSNLKNWKLANMPAGGVCPECGCLRGKDLKQWTLLPNHMYCKYCFIKNVADKDEQKRLKTAFAAAFKLSGDSEELSDGAILREILDIVRMLVPQQTELLNSQFVSQSPDVARAHIRERLAIRSAPAKLGRYLIGPELEEKYGPRLEQLVETSPMSLVRGMNAVLTTPGILAAHRDLVEPVPSWLSSAMKPYTTDITEYASYPAIYVQTLAKGL